MFSHYFSLCLTTISVYVQPRQSIIIRNYYMRVLILILLSTTALGFLASPSQFSELIKKIKPPYFGGEYVAGRTINNNDLTIYYLTKIKHTSKQQLYGKDAIVIDSYMHARQPAAVNMIKQLFQHCIGSVRNNQKLDYFLQNGILLIYAFVNIDSYKPYLNALPSEQDLMRKNLNDVDRKCSEGVGGVDINRNFQSFYGVNQISMNPCGEEYRGLKAFSQNQSAVFKDIFHNFNIKIAIDIHSYGNEWVYPYAADQTGMIIKKHRLYPFYEHIINRFKAQKTVIKSCIDSMHYTADGVYIDWALDQNALSFAYEIGLKWREDDKAVQKYIKQAIAEVMILLEYATPQYQAEIKDSKLFINSISLVSFNVTVEIGSIKMVRLVEPGSLIELKLGPNDQKVDKIGMSVNNKFQKIIELGDDKSPNLFPIILVIIIIALIVFIFWKSLNPKVSDKAIKKTYQQFEDKVVVLQQVNTERNMISL